MPKVAFITGAAGGIGSATARKFAAGGYSLFLTDTDEAGLRTLVDDIEVEAGYAVSDAADESSALSAMEAMLTRFGKVDVAVLNAGIVGSTGRLGAITLEDFRHVMAVNVEGVFTGLSWLMPAMAEHGGGSIVILSSVVGLRGSVGLAPYVASKHAVIGLMRTAALEGAKRGIRVNTVNPAPIETLMMRHIESGRNPTNAEAVRDANAAAIPMKRYGRAEEVAEMISFLAGDAASYCTGNTYLVDGGYHGR
ncbi:SDR family NAD(P)-dependent oxidoreductase [Paracoccus sp. SCSIO 75233]|uniref:SDR family NAD(P)-dependent oxidoreductase n=1 Tax=Paracoccus sp. SCSIO 75233 TaxID=3017782 RepID=UPI0022F0B64B|nr:SDR family NAD(P)-dependent oxidoreductase [Paracoccus sp. SCSIO 75233]WBU52426.1 SDR family NAD(P)-dependent oxidoreductase [Paracoccus sp. SCSIO 75233]